MENLTLNINTETARLADGEEHPFVIYGSPFSATVSLQNGTGGAVTPDPDANYALAIDNDYAFAGTTGEMMAFAEGTVSGAGIVFHRVDTYTTKFGNVINGRPARRAYWQLSKTTGTETIVLATDWLTARGVVMPPQGGTASEIIPYLEQAKAAAQAANNAATAAQEAVASLPNIPTPSPQDNNKVITVSGGTFALSNKLNLQSITISNSTSTSVWNADGIKLYGGALDLYGTTGANRVTVSNGTMTVWGDSMVPATLNSATLTIGTVTNGTFSIPFSIPITQTTASSLSITGDNAYYWDLTASTATNSLDTDILPYNGLEKVWAVDIALGAAASVQYGASFDAAGSDALTASKVNRCVVRFDGTISRLYCYSTEDLA